MYIGSKLIKNAYLGTKAVKAIYKGRNLIWNSVKPLNIIEMGSGIWNSAKYYTFNEDSIVFKMTSGSDTLKHTTQGVETYDLSEYKYLRIKGTSKKTSTQGASGYSFGWRFMIYDADTATELFRYSAPFEGTAENIIDEVIELPDLTGINCQLRMYGTAGLNNDKSFTVTATLTQFELTD